MTHLASPADAAPFTRGQLFAGVLIIGYANGAAFRIGQNVAAEGWVTSVVNLFDISAIVWLGLIAAVVLFWSDRSALRPLDYVVIIIALAAFTVPLSHASWLALTAIALYVLIASPAGPSRSGATVTLALSGAMFWGRVILHTVGEPILEADAALVSFLTGAERIGNTVRLNENDPFIWIAPYCSSMANLSLAILSVVLVVEWEELGWSRAQVLRVLLACTFVVAVNGARISAMLFFPGRFELIHGPIGRMAVSWIIVFGLAFVALLAIRAPRPA